MDRNTAQPIDNFVANAMDGEGVETLTVMRKPRERDMRSDLEKFLDTFMGKPGRSKTCYKNYYIEGNRLMHKATIEDTLHVACLAVHMIQDGKNIFVGNSSVIPSIGVTAAWGNIKWNRGQTAMQRELEKLMPMVPFTAFVEAKLELDKLRLVEQSGAETVTRTEIRSEYDQRRGQHVDKKTDVKVHFTGASLFEIQGKYFLFDIDRNEIAHKIFNPFIAELPGKATSIADAYARLKPKAVIEAEKKGLKVLRQGEWFFIPSKKGPDLKGIKPLARKIGALVAERELLGIREWAKHKLNDKIRALRESYPSQRELRAGPNRPNTAEKGVTQKGVTYVTGKVSHAGREHKDLVLKGWYTVVPNTATRSFTITGDVD